MPLTQIAGRDDEYHEGIQNHPELGDKLTPLTVTADEERIWTYINAMKDERFWAFQASVAMRYGIEVAPLTIFDPVIGSQLVGSSAGFALHAKQGSIYHRPIEVGATCQMGGKVVDITERRGIDYFTMRIDCDPGDGRGNVIDYDYVRAYRFPDNSYKREGSRVRPKLSDWLYEHEAVSRATFPAVGSVIEGRTFHIDQAQMNLYSGARSSIHTSDILARRAGLESTVAQGLMATALEGELYRDIFGLAFYRRGAMHTSYMEQIRRDDTLRAIVVVRESTDDLIRMDSAVATVSGKIVCAGSSSIRNWATEDALPDDEKPREREER